MLWREIRRLARMKKPEVYQGVTVTSFDGENRGKPEWGGWVGDFKKGGGKGTAR